MKIEKRISDEQSIVFDVTAKDGAFEQMFRALGTIAQGNLVDTRNPITEDVTVNPLDTLNRVEEALNLIQDAIFGGGTNASSQNIDLYTIQAKIDSNTVKLIWFSLAKTELEHYCLMLTNCYLAVFVRLKQAYPMMMAGEAELCSLALRWPVYFVLAN